MVNNVQGDTLQTTQSVGVTEAQKTKFVSDECDASYNTAPQPNSEEGMY